MSVYLTQTTALPDSPVFMSVMELLTASIASMQTERDDYLSCEDRQQAQCTKEMDNFETEVNAKWAYAVAANYDILSDLEDTVQRCEASRWGLEKGLRIARATGTVSSYNCSADQQLTLSSLLGMGDLSTNDTDESLASLTGAARNFTDTSHRMYTDLLEYAVARSKYDASYLSNQTTAMVERSTELIAEASSKMTAYLETSFDQLVSDAETMVGCISMSDPEGCPIRGIVSSRMAFDATVRSAQTNVDNLVEEVEEIKAELEEWAEALEEYAANVLAAFYRAVDFWEGVADFLESVPYFPFKMSLGSWADTTIGDFWATEVTLPYYFDNPTSLITLPSGDELWDEVSSVAEEMQANIPLTHTKLQGYMEDLEADLRVEVSALTELEGYDPPLYNTTEVEVQLQSLEQAYNEQMAIQEEYFADEAAAAMAIANAAAALNGTSPSPSTTFNVSAMVNSASQQYTQSETPGYFLASFTGAGVELSDWMWRFSLLSSALFCADILIRSLSSVRTIVRFWKGGGSGFMPHTDMRAADPAVKFNCCGGSNALGAAACMPFLKALVHPFTQMTFVLLVGSFISLQIASFYSPLFHAYRDGCVLHREGSNGTFLTQNAFSLAFNYAATPGQESHWDFYHESEARRDKLCMAMQSGEWTTQAVRAKQLVQIQEQRSEEAALMAECVPMAAVLPTATEEGETEGGEEEEKETEEGEGEEEEQKEEEEEGGGGLAYNTAATEWAEACENPVDEGWEERLSYPGGQTGMEDVYIPVCADAPVCRITCQGPSPILLKAQAEQLCCTAEWWLHAQWLGFAVSLFTFLCLNTSRLIIQSGLLRMHWRSLRPFTLTYLASCDANEGHRMIAQRGQVLSRSVHRTIVKYESTACLMVGVGLLVNLPWLWGLVMLGQQSLAWVPSAGLE